MNELNATHAYRMHLAADEHRALASTLRDRLINSVSSKKSRLSRDKETVEISDSNAMLLHPSQYGVGNPASPGGLHGKRTTRHRRDADELTLTEGTKRKRKAADSDESPAPTRQRLDNGNSTPLWNTERREMTAQQVDSPLYSIDKLFTEKELSLNYNTAALAAHLYVQRHPYSDNVDSPPNGKADSSTSDPTVPAVDDEDADSPAGGASMERQYSHATRSTRAVAPNYVTGLGIDIISDLNYPNNMESLNKQIPKLPPLLATVMQRSWTKGESANQPASLSLDEAAAELEIIRQARSYNEHHGYGRNLDLENGGRSLLEAVAVPRKQAQYFVKSDSKGYSVKTEANARESNIRESIRDEYPATSMYGGEGMSRGPSEIGGTPMSRQNTGEGGSSRGGRKLKPFPAPM